MSETDSNHAMKARAAEACDGRAIARMLGELAEWFPGHVEHLNALNVFPVPDGDTGTNMARTIRSSADAARACDGDAADVLQQAARGALMGAAGNSGVILSQMIRGFSHACRRAETLDAAVFREALNQAVKDGYAAVAEPVEGTILTVARRAAECAADADDSIDVFERAVAGATAAVFETPTQLEQLRAAGVIDAGGEGLRLILEGILRLMRGEPLEVAAPAAVASKALVGEQHTAGELGYCTQFLIEAPGVLADDVRTRLQSLGRSLIVVQADDLVRVHVHADQPGSILDQATAMGRLRNVSIEDMEAQYQQAQSRTTDTSSNIGIVTVAQSAQSARLLSELGAARVVRVEAGDTPTVEQILSAVQGVGYEHILLLPNDKNAVLAANQVQSLTPRSIEIVPTSNLAEAVACLVAFNFASDLEQNLQRMQETLGEIVTLEVARASRAADYPNVRVSVDDYVVIRRGDILSSAPSVDEALRSGLSHCGGSAELVTVYTGADATPEVLEHMHRAIRDTLSDVEVELSETRQPNRVAILAIE